MTLSALAPFAGLIVRSALIQFGSPWQEPATPPTPPTEHTDEGKLAGDAMGLRTALEQFGFSLDASYIYDYSFVPRGAHERMSGGRGLLMLGIGVDLDTAVGWTGATLYAEFQSFAGRDVSGQHLRVVQPVSNIDAADFSEIYELWYEQKLFEDRLRLKVGKVDANSEFAFVENGAEFIHSSMGVSPTLQGLPTYPDPATSINVFAYFPRSLYGGFGLYDGASQKGASSGPRGPSTFFDNDAEFFLLGEAGVRWTRGHSDRFGRLGIGGWHHTATFDRFDGGTEPSATGEYLVFDETLWCDGESEGHPSSAGIFLQYGHANPNISPIAHHVGAGFHVTGLVPLRDQDVVGLGATWVRLSDATGADFDKGHELAIETFYKFQLTGWLSAKPDLQFIANPGGTDSAPDAWVVTVRVEMSF
jgi:porin